MIFLSRDRMNLCEVFYIHLSVHIRLYDHPFICLSIGSLFALELGMVEKRISLLAQTHATDIVHTGLLVSHWPVPFARPIVWVLHLAKVVYFFSPSLSNVEWLILRPLTFFFYQKLFIFRFFRKFFLRTLFA